MEFWHNQLQCNLIFEFAWLYNIFQQQSMLVKPVGTLVKHHHQSNQIFHQTHKIIPQFQTLTVNEPKPLNTKSQSNRKRANSVGKIYNRKSSTNKENTDLPMNTYDRLINYNEVQNKLSKFMQCTINTTQKPKYNYLFQHYNHVNIYQPKYNTHFQYNGAPLRQNSQQFLNKNPSNFISIQRRQSHKNIIQYNNIPYKQAKDHFNSLQNSRKQLKQPNGGQKRMPLALIQAKLQIKPQRKIQKTKQKYNERPPSPKIDKKMTAPQQKSQKKIQKKDCQSKKYEMVGSNKQNHIPLSNAPINKRQMIPLGNRKQNLYNMSGFIHQQHKNQLQMKLKKMINSYQTKNKQLSFEMHKIQQKIGNVKNIEENKVKNIQQNKPFEDIKPEDPPFKQNSLTQAIEKLIEYNLKGICLSKQIDDKLQQTWRSIHKQILVDQNLRIIKCFINESNINTILNQINDNRVKKIEISVLKTHSEEYDPFLLEKLNQILKITNQDFTNKLVIKWISEIFVKYYEESQRNWIKNLSQQKIECFIKNILLQKQINGLRKNEALSKDLNIRDFTRYLSILFKANLRNRNVYQIHNKLKGMTFIGRFIELLQQKAGKGSSCKKSLPMPK